MLPPRIGAEVLVHDPWIEAHAGNVYAKIAGADAVVLMVAHRAYRTRELSRVRKALRTPVLIDGRHLVEADDAASAGLTFRGLGRGISPTRRAR